MKLNEFRDLLDAYGSDSAVWPQAQRLAAERLIETEPQARAWLRAAQRLDERIARAMRAAAPAEASAARVVTALARLPRQRRFPMSWAWPAALLDVDLAPARLRIAALAGVAALGVALGLFSPDVTDSIGSTPETTLAAMFEPEPLTGVRP